MGHPQIARRGITWKTCNRERWDLDRLLDCRCELLAYIGSERPCIYHVIRFSPVWCILIRVFVTLSDMSDDLVAVSKHSNVTFIIVALVI
jgi:uncharacterized protein YjiS (DUF1127 family)